jgi:hypothetical protein
MQGVRRLNLRRHPPPDLAIEVDVTRHTGLDRLAIYAALRVPEVWQLDGDVLTFHVLDAGGQYAVAPVSRSFPFLTPADLLAFVQRGQQAGDQNSVLRDFRAWIRQRQAAAGGPP